MATPQYNRETKTLRILNRQFVAWDDITRGIERSHYEATGQYKTFSQWEVMDRLLAVAEVRQLRERGLTLATKL